MDFMICLVSLAGPNKHVAHGCTENSGNNLFVIRMFIAHSTCQYRFSSAVGFYKSLTTKSAAKLFVEKVQQLTQPREQLMLGYLSVQ
jgi:hypothetical protein